MVLRFTHRVRLGNNNFTCILLILRDELQNFLSHTNLNKIYILIAYEIEFQISSKPLLLSNTDSGHSYDICEESQGK